MGCGNSQSPSGNTSDSWTYGITPLETQGWTSFVSTVIGPISNDLISRAGGVTNGFSAYKTGIGSASLQAGAYSQSSTKTGSSKVSRFISEIRRWWSIGPRSWKSSWLGLYELSSRLKFDFVKNLYCLPDLWTPAGVWIPTSGHKLQERPRTPFRNPFEVRSYSLAVNLFHKQLVTLGVAVRYSPADQLPQNDR